MDVSKESEAGKISAKPFPTKLPDRSHTHTLSRELAPSPKGPLAEPTADVSQIPALKILEVCFLNEISPFQVKQDVR